MGTFRVDDAGIKASMRHSKIIGRAMQNCPDAFRTIPVDAAEFDAGIYNLRHDAIRQATKEIEAEEGH